MQTDNKFFDDFARMATGALGGLQQIKSDMEQFWRAQMDSWLAGQDLVTREEFEAVKAMAVKAREENEQLSARLAAVEAALTNKT